MAHSPQAIQSSGLILQSSSIFSHTFGGFLQMDTFILSFFQQGDKLKASTVYQILIGKRSSSTLLYGYLWYLLPYWSVFPKMKKATFFQLLQEMVDKGWLTEVAPDYFVKTKMAPHLTEAQVEVVAGLQNFKFNKSAPVAWRLLRLLV